MNELKNARLTESKMTKERLTKATETLMKYKSEKTFIEERVVESEEWWKLKQDRLNRKYENPFEREGTSAWLFNTICGKHADAMQAYPEANILPREPSDRAEARILQSIIPCILEKTGFEDVWSREQWQKLKQGTGIYQVYWDKDALNGLGDIAITTADMLSCFWEPGITDIQKSRNFFHTEYWDIETLHEVYPQTVDMAVGKTITPRRYFGLQSAANEDKAVVVDWYYHLNKKLHYCKYVDNTVLYCTEDDPQYAERGLYDHGMYPFVFDPLFPVEASPAGMGYVDVGKSAQGMIDRLNRVISRNAIVNANPRFFIRQDGSVNEDEFGDWTTPLVHVTGNLGEDSVRQINTQPLSEIVLSYLNNKVEELKFTAGNQDVINGRNPSGVTAASAIAALQETAGRMSTDSNKAAYRAFNKVVNMVIELIRQFYDLPRQFRIVGQYGMEDFVTYTNANLRPQPQSIGGVEMGMRLPVFDISTNAAKETGYSAMAQNELALQLYNLGFFNAQNAPTALACLDMMQFDGKDELMQKVQKNGDLMQMLGMVLQYSLALAGKYGDKQAINQIAGMTQQMTGQKPATVTAASDDEQVDIAEPGEELPENTRVANARKRAQESTDVT